MYGTPRSRWIPNEALSKSPGKGRML